MSDQSQQNISETSPMEISRQNTPEVSQQNMSQTHSSEIFNDLQSKVDNLVTSPVNPISNTMTVGFIQSIKDGIALVSGLTSVRYNELVEIELSSTETVTGVTFNLEAESVGILILGDYSDVIAGQKVRATGKDLAVDVNYNYLGRVVNPLGHPIDGNLLNKERSTSMLLERVASGVMTRKPVTRPLKTGVVVIDSLVNVGKGQRELIIGDRQTGKTTLGIDAILNQKSDDVICIYVAIGQKQSKTKQIIEKLTAEGAMGYTIVVNAAASDPVSFQYLAPYAGVAIAEYFCEQGRDVLIIYDDLSKHAWAYRQLSLLFRRPPGREAYPGDVFYLHSRLLERAVQLDDDNGGGSITALPIIETQANDISAYIPTNVISITDGQIFLESDLFNAGIRPAINPGASVTRVGGAAQPKNLKKVAGSLKLELAQYRELAAFSKFGGDLDKTTQDKLQRGAALTQLLIQPPNRPMSLAEEVIIVYAGTKGYLDNLEIGHISDFLTQLKEFAHSYFTDLVETLNTGKWGDEIELEIKKCVQDYIAQR